MTMKNRSLFLAILIMATILPCIIIGQSLPSPEEAFGFRMGSDRKLIDWYQIVDYFRTVDQTSDRILVQELGKTTLDKPFLLAVISSDQNIKNLERYQRIQQQIANPYDLP